MTQPTPVPTPTRSPPPLGRVPQMTPAMLSPEGLPAGLCVLVADDNPLNLLLVSEMLRYFGVEPLLAADGAEAVAKAALYQPHLILMDIQMPVLDGIAATRQIRQAAHAHLRRRVPVVAYSANTERLQTNRPDFDGVLDKPCELDSLQACLVRWCAQV